jgi:hypothetical protein
VNTDFPFAGDNGPALASFSDTAASAADYKWRYDPAAEAAASNADTDTPVEAAKFEAIAGSPLVGLVPTSSAAADPSASLASAALLLCSTVLALGRVL